MLTSAPLRIAAVTVVAVRFAEDRLLRLMNRVPARAHNEPISGHRRISDFATNMAG